MNLHSYQHSGGFNTLYLSPNLTKSQYHKDKRKMKINTYKNTIGAR